MVAPTTINPAITRLIGTVDIDGAGTQHSLPEVDPFILLDAGTITKNQMPPFGAHPHYGHSVVTILLQGKMEAWDSFRDVASKSDLPVLQAPSSYWVDAGSGVFHDERSVIENEDDQSQHVRLFQLWIGVKDIDRSKPPRVQFSIPGKLPVVDLKGDNGETVGRATVHVGEGSGIETLHPVSVMHVKQSSGTTCNIPVKPTHGGFVVHVAGKATYGKDTTVEDLNSVLVIDNSNDSSGPDQLQVTSSSEGDDDIEYLVCSGERIEEPWSKKLAANGAMIKRTPEEARELAKKVEQMSKAGKAEGGNFAPFGLPGVQLPK